MSFDFENLNVYKQALELVDISADITTLASPKVPKALLDQLCRAATSVPLNIAEGTGRWNKGEKKQFFRIAQGSVYECVPVIQVLRRRKAIEETVYQTCYAHLVTTSKMLTGLIKSVDQLNR